MGVKTELENDNDIPKYKKKSHKNRLKRSKHKHQNIYVQLEYLDRHKLEIYGDHQVKTGESITRCLAEVCQICGRIHTKYFNFGFDYNGIIPIEISYDDYLQTLPVWHCDSFKDKFAEPNSYNKV